MHRNLAFLFSFAVAVIAAGASLAQEKVLGNPAPLSNTGGYAGQQLRGIYRQAIGTGYSVDTLNKQTLNRNTVRVPNVGQSSAPGSRLDSGLGAFGNLNKPFANYQPAPTTSPYLNLFLDNNDTNDDFNYQTLVRPQLQQREFNERVQREAYDLGRQLQSMAARPDFNPAGSTAQPPTGHQTVFQYYGHYYPQMQQRRR